MPQLVRFALPRALPRGFGPWAAGVVALAAALRLGLVVASPGGVRGSYGYDASVYYAAADAMLHGRLPYRDFLMLHPPGIILALLPVAALGQLVGDHDAFMVGNALFTLLGAVNAGLVMVVARRLRLPQRAVVLGGLFYAVWFGAVEAEISARLEPLGTILFLAGLALGSGPQPRRRTLLLAGAALAGAVSVKIWWVVPVLVVLVWWTVQRRREAAPVLAGAVLLGLVLDGPFLLLAPRDMARMLVTDQLGRPEVGLQGLHRAAHVMSIEQAFPDRGRAGLAVVGLLLVLGGLLLAGLAWQVRACRLLVVVLAVQLALVMAVPSYFVFYSGYPGAALALTVAAAASAPHVRLARAVPGAALVAACALTVITGVAHRPAFTTPVRGAADLARAVEGTRCLVSDTPMALIQLNALSRGLANDCPNWIDVTGRTYDVDAPPDDGPQGRLHNAKWQEDLRRYLLSGDAVILFRRETGADAETLRTIRELPVLARSEGLTVYRTR